VFLSKLIPNVTSREFRRDHADTAQMHRTMMRAFPEYQGDEPARQAYGVLWRLDPDTRGFVLYVQSGLRPDWGRLVDGYLAQPAQVRDAQPVLDSITPGRKLAFRLVANPTYAKAVEGPQGIRGKRVAHTTPDKQVEWLVRHGERHGFVIPTGANGRPDVAPIPCLTMTGQSSRDKKSQIMVVPVRFDGHLIVTDVDAFTAAVRDGVGRGKAYGCGLITLAPPRSARAQPAY
jgi:CRISPR system Cascade subunit CasE